MSKLTAEDYWRVLDYDPETGVFTWKVALSNRVKVGRRAGVQMQNGYRFVTVFKVGMLEHRLAWLMTTGKMPPEEIDHINGVRNDNRICNLRAVSRKVNRENQRKVRSNSRTGFQGVQRDGNSYFALVHVKGKSVRSRRFKTPEEAHQAYVLLKRQYHEGCTL